MIVEESIFARVRIFFQNRITAFFQKGNMVYIRPPGGRFLEGPHPAGPYAGRHWQFAMISEASYGRSLDPDQKEKQRNRATKAAKRRRRPVEVVDVDGELQKVGWRRWINKEAFSKELYDQIVDAHLRIEVWEHEAKSLVVVAFGGTVFTSGKDWIANLRWFLPRSNDEYTVLVRTFTPAFINALIARKGEPNRSWLNGATICATGHSLGGGLAQQFAYALPFGKGIKPVSHVYAFDPSPVTGFYSVCKSTRKRNAEGMEIERIYERGEILAILRSFTSLFLPPSTKNPLINGTRYSFFYSADFLGNHSMIKLAIKLQAAAGVGSHNPNNGLIT